MLLLGLWVLLAAVVAAAAAERGRSATAWFLLAIVASPLIAVILLIAFPNLRGLNSVDDLELERQVRSGRQRVHSADASEGGRIGAGALAFAVATALFAVAVWALGGRLPLSWFDGLTHSPPPAQSPALKSSSQTGLLVPRGTEKPSFDCSNAKTAAARLICADGELAQLDGELGAVFQRRKAQMPDADQRDFATSELTWIRDRNRRCGLLAVNEAAVDVLALAKPCMASVIRERIAFLAGAESQTEPASLTPVGQTPLAGKEWLQSAPAFCRSAPYDRLSPAQMATCNEASFRYLSRKWQTVTAANGQAYEIATDTIVRGLPDDVDQRAEMRGAEVLAYMRQGEVFNSGNVIRFFFDCKDHFQEERGREPLSQVEYAPPNSVVAKIASIACGSD